MRNALVAAYSAMYGNGKKPATDATVTIAPRPALDHTGQEQPDRFHDGFHMDTHHLANTWDRMIQKRAEQPEPGVVHQYVDVRCTLPGGNEQPVRGIRLRKVQYLNAHLPAMLPFQCIRQRSKPKTVTCREQHIIAIGGEGRRIGGSNPTRGARHDGKGALLFHGSVCSV